MPDAELAEPVKQLEYRLSETTWRRRKRKHRKIGRTPEGTTIRIIEEKCISS